MAPLIHNYLAFRTKRHSYNRLEVSCFLPTAFPHTFTTLFNSLTPDSKACTPTQKWERLNWSNATPIDGTQNISINIKRSQFLKAEYSWLTYFMEKNYARIKSQFAV